MQTSLDPRVFDAAALKVFAEKGLTDSRTLGQTGNGNAVKVRRITQLVQDLARKPISDLRVLDIACAEGVYSLELANRGAQCVAYDVRDERLNWGREIAERHDLPVEFSVDDIRKVSRESHGEFDVILMLGILYHLDFDTSIVALHHAAQMCRGMLIIDTHVSLRGGDYEQFNGAKYHGQTVREHAKGVSQSDKRADLLQSDTNDTSFWFTPDSLVSLLRSVGFTTVLECHAPLEPNKADNRKTFVAIAGRPVEIATYPSINGLSDAQLAERFPKTKPVKRSLLSRIMRRLRVSLT